MANGRKTRGKGPKSETEVEAEAEAEVEVEVEADVKVKAEAEAGPEDELDRLLDHEVKELLHLLKKLGRTGTGKGGGEESLVSVIGAVPGFAAAESMLAQANSEGILFTNAVQQQSRLATVGLLATLGSVVQILQMNDYPPFMGEDTDED